MNNLQMWIRRPENFVERFHDRLDYEMKILPLEMKLLSMNVKILPMTNGASTVAMRSAQAPDLAASSTMARPIVDDPVLGIPKARNQCAHRKSLILKSVVAIVVIVKHEVLATDPRQQKEVARKQNPHTSLGW